MPLSNNTKETLVVAMGNRTAANEIIATIDSPSQIVNGYNVGPALTTTTGFQTIGTIPTITDNTTYYAIVQLSGRKTNGLVHGGLLLRASLFKENGTLTLIAAATIDASRQDATWAGQLVVSGNQLLIQAHGNSVTPENVIWRAFINMVAV